MNFVASDLISVIMPCHNAASWIANSAASVLDQTHTAIELIVVDDGSTDSSPGILRDLSAKDPRAKVLSQPNLGAGPARNRGLKEARGAYVAFLDADDYWAPTCLERLRQGLLAESADLAYCGWQNVGLPTGRCQPFVPENYENTDKIDTFLGGCRWPIHAALTRRHVIERAAGFDERWSSCMDYDLWLRIAPFIKLARVPEVLAFYRHHEGPQITKNRARVALNHWLVQHEFIRNHSRAVRHLSQSRLRELTHGELLRRGYASYWDRDFEAARTIFRKVMRSGYGRLRDWKYMLAAWLPLRVRQALSEQG